MDAVLSGIATVTAVTKPVCMSVAMFIAYFNLYAWGAILCMSVLLHSLALIGVLAPAKPPPLPKGRKEYARTDIYQRWMDQSEKWFTFSDCCSRFWTDTVGFYIAICSRPFRFIRFNLLVLPLWYDPKTIVGFLENAYYLLFLPVMPLTTVLFEGVFRPLKYLTGLEIDYSKATTGGVFFKKPEGFWSKLLWESHIWMGTHVGQFWVVGTHGSSVSGSYKDTELNKYFFRDDVFKTIGAKTAGELATYSGRKLTMGDDLKPKSKVFCKASDECLGAGDYVCTDWDPKKGTMVAEVLVDEEGNAAKSGVSKEPKEFKTWKITEFMEWLYEDQNALIMVFAMPQKMIKDKKLGVHQYDILTAVTPDGDVQVLWSQFWGGCTGDTTHSAGLGMVIDAHTGKFCGGICHYTPHFNSPEARKQCAEWAGMDAPLFDEACKTAIAAHKVINRPF